MRISDCSSDVCSSDLLIEPDVPVRRLEPEAFMKAVLLDQAVFIHRSAPASSPRICFSLSFAAKPQSLKGRRAIAPKAGKPPKPSPSAYVSFRSEASETILADRSDAHTSELQSLMRISYAVFCLKKQT